MLSEYAQCNCCLWGRAQHRDNIEDLQLLTPLAQRWLNEIRAQAVESLDKAKSVMWVTSTNYRFLEPIINIYHRLIRDRTAAAVVSDDTGKPSMCKAANTYTSHLPTSPSTSSLIFNELEHRRGHELQTCRANSSPNLAHLHPLAATQPALSEFRCHIVEPTPGDSVYQRILTRLRKRDFETGSLYIFDRESSPGHVKIGWTAKNVSDRLANCSKCGYEPNLLFSMNHIPHAQRVETLVHYELIKEWRRERRCKAPWCGKSHKEWFEASKELAERTVRDWAEFVQSAKPYDVQGHLKDQWKELIKGIYRETKEVTAQRLLSLLRKIVMNKTISTEKSVGQLRVPKTGKEINRPLPRAKPPKKSEEEDGCGNVFKMEQTEQSKRNSLKKMSVKSFEPDLLVKSEFAQEVKTIHAPSQTGDSGSQGVAYF
ncbi:hypothetical protein N7453_002301 [Penicillium expansum]|nr:hypothetical protein N7453_002301 [Penicillium expansum]